MGVVGWEGEGGGSDRIGLDGKGVSDDRPVWEGEVSDGMGLRRE